MTGGTSGGSGIRFDPADCRAVIFDMDGVITDTAEIHFAAWKALFDPLLRDRSERDFDEADYRTHVDGKPRLDGLRSFLSSRGISLPDGRPEEDADAATIHGLARRKNALFQACLDRQGIRAFEDTVALIGRLKAAGIRVAAISSSRNAEHVLRSAGVSDLFEVLVDGEAAAAAGLAGKPAPDIFLHAARALGVDPPAAAIVEDAVSGVAAGRAGRFGLVVGLARHPGEEDGLLAAGADVALRDLCGASVGGAHP